MSLYYSLCKLKKQIVERVLTSELDQEVGYDKHSKLAKDDGNRRNGSFEKIIIDGDGHKITIDVPRDRAGEFTPQLVPLKKSGDLAVLMIK